ncbi:selenide, water dikinase SelD [Methylobacterium fujisawaense]|uniref:selenide, water dikinase SelD n=1 Tax=Methylobacterium fujisawaense TaxID=107400 RepID=UPI0037012E3B
MNALPQPLMSYSPAGGCACKVPQSVVEQVTAFVGGGGGGGRLLVGLEAPDDAAVYALDDHRALVVTLDFLTPVVNDVYDWGRIAAANALSDVYAMGGRPLLALNILGCPKDFPQQMLQRLLAGGQDSVTRAGAVLAGGHSIVDASPKYGLAVVGEVERDRVITKGGGRIGDVLVLTKALGVGVVSTAIKRGIASEAHIGRATDSMVRLNADAAAVARDFGVRGGTDVTGYGLVGHLHEMAAAAGLGARIYRNRVPVIDGVRDLLRQGCAPDGSVRTLDNALSAGWLEAGEADRDSQVLLADAQTSGSLLLAVARRHADALVAALQAAGERDAAIVGEFVPGAAGVIAL